jgi:hypothetical protein
MQRRLTRKRRPTLTKASVRRSGLANYDAYRVSPIAPSWLVSRIETATAQQVDGPGDSPPPVPVGDGTAQREHFVRAGGRNPLGLAGFAGFPHLQDPSYDGPRLG